MANALTIRSFMPGHDPGGWLKQNFPQHAAWRSLQVALPSVPRESLAELLADQVDKLLDLNLIEVFIGVWLKHRELAALADNQGAGELVELAEHRMSSVHQPKIDVLLAGKPVFQLAVGITLELQFRGVQLLLRERRIREVRLGEIEGEGSFSIEGHELARQSFGELDLPGIIRLDPGISLAA